MRISPRFRAGLSLLVLAAPLGGCDKIQGLIDGDKGADESDAKAKAEAKADAKEDPETRADPGAVAVAKEETKEEAPAADDKPAEAAAEPDTQCIVGHWEATDYLAQIDRALRKDPTLRSLGYKSKSGTIGYRIEAPVDGKGVVKTKASDLKYAYAGKVKGIGVSVSVKMSGEITSSYTLAEPSRIIVDKPTENKMTVKTRVKLKGLGSARDSSKVDHDFDGDFPYECAGDDLTVWTLGKDKRPLRFKRLAD